MNIQKLHAYLGALLQAGVDPTLPVASDAMLLAGTYYYDPDPKMIANSSRQGTVLVLKPVFEDVSDAVNDGRLKVCTLPAEVTDLD